MSMHRGVPIPASVKDRMVCVVPLEGSLDVCGQALTPLGHLQGAQSRRGEAGHGRRVLRVLPEFNWRSDAEAGPPDVRPDAPAMVWPPVHAVMQVAVMQVAVMQVAVLYGRPAAARAQAQVGHGTHRWLAPMLG